MQDKIKELERRIEKIERFLFGNNTDMVKDKVICYLRKNKIDISRNISYDEQKKMAYTLDTGYSYIRKILYKIRSGK